MIVHTEHTTFGVCHRLNLPIGSIVWLSTESRRSSGRANYSRRLSDSQSVRSQSGNDARLAVFLEYLSISDRFNLSCDPVLSKVGSPPAHRQQKPKSTQTGGSSSPSTADSKPRDLHLPVPTAGTFPMSSTLHRDRRACGTRATG